MRYKDLIMNILKTLVIVTNIIFLNLLGVFAMYGYYTVRANSKSNEILYSSSPYYLIPYIFSGYFFLILGISTYYIYKIGKKLYQYRGKKC